MNTWKQCTAGLIVIKGNVHVAQFICDQIQCKTQFITNGNYNAWVNLYRTAVYDSIYEQIKCIVSIYGQKQCMTQIMTNNNA